MVVQGIKPDHYTYPCILSACSGSLHLLGGLQIHGAVTKLGLLSNLFVSNTLITMYWRCRRPEEAEQVFGEMRYKDAISWNSMIAGYSQTGDPLRALEFFKTMVQSGGAKPNSATLASLLSTVTTTLVSGDICFLRKMFDEMPRRELISWNAMIAIYANNSMAGEAVRLYEEMERERVAPDAITFVSVLPACGDLSALSLGARIHTHIKSKSFCPNLFLENALVDMYSKCGDLISARSVFDAMKNKDVVSWTSIISGYGMHGLGAEAISLFQNMINSGLKPDNIAFISVLSACSHSGLLPQGKLYFSAMTDKYKLTPTVEHFTCMVDLLGRAGRVEEAYDFVKSMSVKPDERIWGALLSACRLHSNIEVGLEAADNLFKLAPPQSGYYVLLSNIYARAGRWGGVTEVRRAMRDQGVQKSPGWSNVEVSGRVHTFMMEDRSHAQSSEIYMELEALVGKMKEAGYVADTDVALHDVEEEDKEGHLAVHSEKLAIVFALMSTPPGMVIRITKNLRVCGDCHSAAKIISRITRREIILRDIHRFHHFENGLCSCKDYW